MLRNKKMNSCIGLLLAMVMVFGLCGCGIVKKEADSDEATVNEAGNTENDSKDSEKKDSEEIRPQDDFYGYVNKDTLLNLDLHYGEAYGGPTVDIMNDVNAEIISLISDIANSNKSYEPGTNEQLVKDAYIQFLNQENIGNLGVEHFNERLKEINEAKDTDELLDIIGEIAKEEGQLLYFDIMIERNFFESEENALYIEQKDSIFNIALKDIYESDEERQMLRSYVLDALLACGEELDEAGKKADDFVYFAIDVAGKTDYQIMEAENPYASFVFYNKDAIDGILKNVGMDNFERIMGIKDNPYGGWYVIDTEQLEMLDASFSDDNLECIKTYLICELMYRYNYFLTDEYEFLKLYVPASHQTKETETALYINGLLEYRVSELYADKYYTEEMDEELTRMYEDIKEGYRILINEADWLSEATRKVLIKKLDNMYFVKGGGTPHEVDKNDAKLIGDDAFMTFVNVKKDNYNKQLGKIGKAHDKSNSVMSAQTVNSMYGIDNSFNITVAIMHAPYFDEDADYYTNLGGLGMVVAHEMGHAFDSNCINYDADGNYNPDWIGKEDREELNNRMDRMIEYYSSFTIMDIYHVDGRLTCGENYADKGGMECLMKIAKTDEQRRMLFENYAYIWCTMLEDTVAMEKLQIDEHSPECIRVNAVLSSTDEFYELYDVNPGDGMYVEPENRVSRW